MFFLHFFFFAEITRNLSTNKLAYLLGNDKPSNSFIIVIIAIIFLLYLFDWFYLRKICFFFLKLYFLLINYLKICTIYQQSFTVSYLIFYLFFPYVLLSLKLLFNCSRKKEKKCKFIYISISKRFRFRWKNCGWFLLHNESGETNKKDLRVIDSFCKIKKKIKISSKVISLVYCGSQMRLVLTPLK